MLFFDSPVHLQTSRRFLHSYPTGGSVCKLFDEAFLNGDCAGVVYTAYLPYEAIAEPEPHVEQTLHLVHTKECFADSVYSAWAQELGKGLKISGFKSPLLVLVL